MCAKRSRNYRLLVTKTPQFVIAHMKNDNSSKLFESMVLQANPLQRKMLRDAITIDIAIRRYPTRETRTIYTIYTIGNEYEVNSDDST